MLTAHHRRAINIVSSLILIVLVLLHSGKGGGLSDMFGGGMGATAVGSTVRGEARGEVRQPHGQGHHPDGPRNQLVGSTWDSTAVLLEAGAAIETTAKKLPYVAGF